MTTLNHIRRDSLPEHNDYNDDGCEVSETCIGCPLLVCKHDDPGYNMRQNRDIRNAAIVKDRKSGKTIEWLAAKYGVSIRTTHRILHRDREGHVVVAAQRLTEDSPDITIEELQKLSVFRVREPWPAIK